jgi:hypothetical protein
VDRLEEKIPEDVGFGGIMVLSMVFPVDIKCAPADENN